MTDLPPLGDIDLFDEAGYLRLYPGIAVAIMQGNVDTAWNHYQSHGRGEGRQPNDVDPGFYLTAYPRIERDLGHPPSEADAAPHFITLGRARGYLPNGNAPRSANAAATGSPFGGLWIDQANALDLIQARRDLDRLRHKDAAMLRTFALEGIVDLDRPNDQERIQNAALFVHKAFTGAFEPLLFAGPEYWTDPQPWRPELTEQNIAALDPHMVSGEVRAFLFDKTVIDFLTLLFDAPVRLTASRAYLRQAATPERDVAWLAHTLPLQFVAVTFDLEDSEDGPALVWPGSHRFPDLLWSGEHVNLMEARRAGAMDLEQAMSRREEQVRTSLRGREPRRLGSTAGQRRIRHANVIHAVAAPSPPLQRRSLTAWYCPSYVTPCYAEAVRARSHVQDGCEFSSGVYPDMDPSG